MAQQPQRAVGEARLQQGADHGGLRPRERVGHGAEHLTHNRRHVHGQPTSVEVAQQLREPRGRAAAVDQRSVPTRSADGRPQPADLLLGDLDRIETPAARGEREAAELAEREADPVEQLRVFLDEEPRTEVTAVLLVGEDAEDEIAGWADAFLSCAQEGRHEHCHASLHVERAAAPDLAFDESPLERGLRPLLPGGRDHVDVSLEEERRRTPLALESRDQVRPRGIPRVGLRLDAGALELLAEEADAGGLVPRRIGRVEAEQLLQHLGGSQQSSSSAASSRSTSAAVL